MAVIDETIFFSTITELNAKLRAREFSAEELTRAYLERLERLGPRYNALALTFHEEALRDAHDVDGDLKRERFRGPLQGIPFAVKDLLSVAGSPTTWGARPFAGQVFDFTATAVRRLQTARAVIIGKLSMIELAGGGGYNTASASLQGPGINPWDRSRWAGGSSSGPGSAVAAGLVPFALGSETSGSILTPCAYCGVTGLRPTYGLVSRYGAMALSWSLDKIGPMCRSADDCGHVLQILAGRDNNDPGTAGKTFYYAPRYSRKPADLTIGYHPGDFQDWADPAARPALQAALEVFRSMGSKLVEVSLPDFPYGAVISTIIGAEGGSSFEDLIRSGKVDQLADPEQIAGLKSALEIPAIAYLRAQRIRRLIQQEFRKLFTQADVLLAPTRDDLAPPVNEPLDRPTPIPPPPTPQLGLRRHISASNLAGLPALALPCGFAGSLPVGISLIGRAFSENTLLAFGREYQGKTDWHRRRPPV